MASARGFDGFECADHTESLIVVSGNARIFADGAARTGDWFLRLQNGSAAAAGYATVVGGITGSSLGLADGETLTYLARVYFRLGHYPSVSDATFFGCGTATEAFRSGLAIDTSGHIAAKTHTTLGSYGSVPLPLNEWLRVEMVHVLTNTPASSDNTLVVTFDVYDEDDNLVDTCTGTFASTSAANGANIILGGNNVATTKRADYDDLVWACGSGADAIGLALPTQRRISPIYVTGQGASADWTGDWQRVAEVPGIGTTDEITTSTDEASTTYTHESCATLGIEDIYAVKIMGHFRSTISSGAEAWLIGGTEHTANVVGSYTTTLTAYDYTAYSTAALDALEFGARNKRGVAVQLGMILLEVLHGGEDPAEQRDLFAGGSYQHKVGYYTGDGTFDREITGVGFRPEVLIIKKTNGGTAGTVTKTWKMGRFRTHQTVNGVLTADYIQHFTDDGFIITDSTLVNESTRGFTYLAIRDGGIHGDGAFFKHGMYLGDGVAGHDVLIEDGWQVDDLLASGGTAVIYKSRTMHAAAEAMQLASAPDITNLITGIDTNGFELGSSATINANQGYYWYAGWRQDAALAPFMVTSSFVASGTSHTVTGLDFTPALVWADRAATGDAGWRSTQNPLQTGIASNGFSISTLQNTFITALAAAGFSVGATIAVNGATAYFLCWLLEAEIEGLRAVPDVIGMTLAEATAEIEGEELVVGSVTGDGVVVDQTPDAGTFVDFGTEVDLVLDGPPDLEDPGDQTNTEGDVVSLQLEATEVNPGSLTYSATNLPPGLSINSSSGLITGTIDLGSAGVYTVTATVDTGWFTDDEVFTWTVLAGLEPIDVLPDTLPDPQSVIPYSQQLYATGGDGGPYTFSLLSGTLPTGLSLSAGGLISGTATTTTIIIPTSWPDGLVDTSYEQQLTLVETEVEVGYAFTVRATDGLGNTGDQAYAVTVRTGWMENKVFEVVNHSLPSCLTCTRYGLISGIPITVGTFPVTVRVISGLGSTVTLTVTLTVTS